MVLPVSRGQYLQVLPCTNIYCWSLCRIPALVEQGNVGSMQWINNTLGGGLPNDLAHQCVWIIQVSYKVYNEIHCRKAHCYVWIWTTEIKNHIQHLLFHHKNPKITFIKEQKLHSWQVMSTHWIYCDDLFPVEFQHSSKQRPDLYKFYTGLEMADLVTLAKTSLSCYAG